MRCEAEKLRTLSEAELEQISSVFHQFETGVRSGTIKPGVGSSIEILETCNPDQ